MADLGDMKTWIAVGPYGSTRIVTSQQNQLEGEELVPLSRWVAGVEAKALSDAAEILWPTSDGLPADLTGSADEEGEQLEAMIDRELWAAAASLRNAADDVAEGQRD